MKKPNKRPRTKLRELPRRSITTLPDELLEAVNGPLETVTGGAMKDPTLEDTMTWTAPQHEDDIFRIDDQ